MQRLLRRRNWWLALAVAGFAAILAFNWGLTHWLTRQVDRSAAALAQRWAGDNLPAPTPGYWRVQHIPAQPPQDPTNTAHHLLLALEALPPTPVAATAFDDPEVSRNLPLSDEIIDVTRRVVAGDDQARAHVRDARQGTYADWGLPEMSINMMLPLLNEQRRLANHLWWAAALAFHDGDLGEAMEIVYDLSVLGAAVADYGPSLVAALVSTGIEAQGAVRLREIILHGLNDDPEAVEAQWQRIEALIALMLDDRRHERRMSLAFRGEAVMQWHLQDEVAAESVFSALLQAPGPGESRAMRPIVRASLLGSADGVARLAELRPGEIFAQPEGVRLPMPRLLTLESGAAAGLQLAPAFMLPATDRAANALHRTPTEQRVAAVMLAVLLYRVDHGALPPDLEALVPGYLPYVPLDPFDPAQLPLRYRTDTPLPVVYSVGENGIDNGGDVAPLGRFDRPFSPWERRDYVFPLLPPPDPAIDPYQYLKPLSGPLGPPASPHVGQP